MDLQEFLNYMNSGKEVISGSAIQQYMVYLAQEAIKVTVELNNQYHSPDAIRQLMSKLTNSTIDSSFSLFPPFYTDCGKNLKIGKNVFFNSGCKIQDQGGVIIEDGVFLGHNVVIATLNHNQDPKKRANLIPAPVKIGKNVWIGSNVTICPGVTIGDGAIVAAGAVVNKDVTKNTVVGGVPSSLIKQIETIEE